jgi:3-hydroxybutyrate dehydrogenase
MAEHCLSGRVAVVTGSTSGIGAGVAEAPIGATASELGGVHALVNNAGIQFTLPMESSPSGRWNAATAINPVAAFQAMPMAISSMKQACWERIISIASVVGRAGLTKVAAVAFAHDGETYNAICPGRVLTPLVDAQITGRAWQEAAVRRDLPAEKQPMLAFTAPARIGALAVFLGTDAAAAMTGALLPIDGWWVAA